MRSKLIARVASIVLLATIVVAWGQPDPVAGSRPKIGNLSKDLPADRTDRTDDDSGQ